LFVAAAAFLIAPGCGGGPSDAPKTVPASGVVKHNGNPVAGVLVTFFPEKGPLAVGTTDAAGAFSLSTSGVPGATAGNHRVSVAWVPEDAPMPLTPEEGQAQAQKSPIPARYGDPNTSQLTQSLGAEGSTSIEINLAD
jgi:hypothetical protein